MGSDHPQSDYAYRYFAGSLFVGNPAYTDSAQGYLGDCYFIASLDTIAKSSPTAIQNMFVDNGDNTWTVRYYCNGAADYVTVDRYLPTYSNYAVYADVRRHLHEKRQRVVDGSGREGLCPVERNGQGGPRRPQRLWQHRRRMDANRLPAGAGNRVANVLVAHMNPTNNI